MKTTLTILHLLLFPVFTFAQINLDSIKSQIEGSNDWIKTGTIEYLTEPFQRFEKIDSTESYDFYIDSTGNLSEYLGLSGVYKQFDNQNRIIKRIGYNLKGNYYLWDYSPIEITEYHTDTTIVNHYNNQFVLSERVVTIKDSEERVIETIYFDKKLEMNIKTIKEYDDSNNELLTMTFDSNDRIKLNELGVAIKWQKFKTKNWDQIIEERFYDDKMNLVDANHNLSNSNFKCIYSIVKREVKNDKEFISYFNSKGELQCESDGASIWTIK